MHSRLACTYSADVACLCCSRHSVVYRMTLLCSVLKARPTCTPWPAGRCRLRHPVCVAAHTGLTDCRHAQTSSNFKKCAHLWAQSFSKISATSAAQSVTQIWCCRMDEDKPSLSACSRSASGSGSSGSLRRSVCQRQRAALFWQRMLLGTAKGLCRRGAQSPGAST